MKNEIERDLQRRSSRKKNRTGDRRRKRRKCSECKRKKTLNKQLSFTMSTSRDGSSNYLFLTTETQYEMQRLLTILGY